jgi:hypothetical protein
MTDNENHEIGRRVIGLMMAHLLPAGIARIRHFQEGAKQVPAPTLGTAAEKTLAHSLQHVALGTLNDRVGSHGGKVGI